MRDWVHMVAYGTAGLIGLYVALQPNALKVEAGTANWVSRAIGRLASPGVAGLPNRAKKK